MAATQPKAQNSPPQRRTSRDRQESKRSPPLPDGNRREGIPEEGPLPHGEEPARPRDTGRQGA